MSGIATSEPGLVGEGYVDADGTEDLDLVSLAIRRPKNAVDRITKGARKHD